MKIEDWKDWMRGRHAIVVAPGPSSLEVSPHIYEAHWTIAVNRALPYARADFAVCIERDNRDVCWRVVDACAPLVTFSQTKKGKPGICFIDMDLRQWPLNDGMGLLRLPMSPFYAAAVGTWLGFERIGLIGVDLYKAQYPSERFKAEWEEAWGRLVKIASECGTEVVKLNHASRLDAVPKGEWESLHEKTYLSSLCRGPK